MDVRTTISALLLGLAVACSPSSPWPTAHEQPNVLLVVVDSLRADHVAADSAPAIAALAAEGVWFERAYSTSSWNMPAVASILTGRAPSEHGVLGIADGLPTDLPVLPAELARSGYATTAVISDFRLGRGRGFDRGFDSFEAEEARGDDSQSSAGVTRLARAALERHAASAQPFLLFVHYYDPHAAWNDHADIDLADPAGTSLRGGESLEELRAADLTAAEKDLVRALYHEEVLAADRGVGELLAALDDLGLADDTAVVVVGSHGQELFDRGLIGPATSLYEEQVRVPLALRVPGGPSGAVVEEPVSLASLAPTILSWAGCAPIGAAPSLASRISGGPLRPAPVAFEVDFEPAIAGHTSRPRHLRGVVGLRFKLVRDEASDALELFDLRSDPLERTNLVSSYPSEVERLLPFLSARP